MNKSPLICVLRARGFNPDLKLAMVDTSVRPYQIAVDSNEITWLSYKISNHDILNSEDLEAAVRKFITENERYLSSLRESGGVSHFELDIGLIIDDGMMSRSLKLSPEVLAEMGKLGVTYVLSAYRGGEPD